MSITAPMHWTMVPDVWASAMRFPSGAFQNGFPLPSPPHLEEGCPRSGRGGGGDLSFASSYRRRAADDLGDLFGDPRLPVLVVDERQLVDQRLHLRPVAELDDVRYDLRAQALHEAQALAADRADFHFLALSLPLLVFPEREAEEIGVQGAAQALVGGDDDHPHALHRVALDEEGVPVLGVGVADVRGDVADLLAVGARVAHALLRLPHLGGGDHLHRLGDLPGVLHTPDFHPDFFCSWHLFIPLVILRRPQAAKNLLFIWRKADPSLPSG